MPAFRYEAVDATGRLTRGTVEADTPRGARDSLRARGLTPTAVDDAAPPAAGFARWSAGDTAMFTRQWSTLVQSGMPIDQALAAVAEQADAPRVAKVVTALRGHVASGEALPVALGRFPHCFPPLYRGLVAAGVDSGRLGDVLARLAEYLEARLALRQRFATALIYPALVTAVALGVIAVLLVYVVPQVVAVYEQSRQTLPWLTRALIATSGFLRATGLAWLGLALAFAVAAALALRRPAVRARWHALLLRLPGVGRLAGSLDAARFASTLAILVGAGTPLLRAMDTAAGVVRLRPVVDAAAAAAERVREGAPLARALREQRLFPPVLVHLVANGEQTGRLAPMLERAAGELERDAETRLAWSAALLQPVLIVLMGAIVLVLVLAVMLPIVSMNQLIR
ncbi:MAG: type II secretion system protein GspF [Betaproteobacteria bacterium]|nr:MAG: type II secretion system protein GspF [Betaproteobacteria bacterium]